MSKTSRREMLLDVGRGMLTASLGSVAADMGLTARAWAETDPGRLHFGELDPLVDFIHATSADRLVPKVIDRLRTGTDLKQIVAAAALANARAFGGEDYVGFHTLMALPPAFHMANEESDPKLRALPVLKVLLRNATRFTEAGSPEVLKPQSAMTPATGTALRDYVRKAELDSAERACISLCQGSTRDAVDGIMSMVDDGAEVHRVVMVSRSIELLDYVGQKRAQTLLRQSVRYCLKAEQNSSYVKQYQEIREKIPALIDRTQKDRSGSEGRMAEDRWVAEFADTIFRASPFQAAEAVTTALVEGFSHQAIGEALSLAANQLILRDEGRPAAWTQANKPIGSCHGDSIGVHAADATHGWRAIALAGSPRTAAACLILAAWQVAKDRYRPEFPSWEPYPRPAHREAVRSVAVDSLLPELDQAIRDKDQGRAAALTQRIGDEKPAMAKQVFDLFRRYAISEDGALHAEKFYRTVTEEYARARSAFRWRYLVGLARVTASAYGYAAPGVTEARQQLAKG